MRKVLFSILIDLLFLHPLFSQDTGQIKTFSDEQYQSGNHQVALKEYQRVLLFDTDKQFTDIYYKIATIYFLEDNYKEAIKYYNMAWNVEHNDSSRNELIFLKALCFFKQSGYFEALNELMDLPEGGLAYFRDKKNLFFGICYYGLNEYETSLEYFSQLLDSTGVQKIKRLYTDLYKLRKKFDPDKVEIMSLLFPGSGQVYAGNIVSGLNSFILLGGIVFYGIYTAVNYGFIDGLLILNSWFYRYYRGGAKNAARIAQRKLEDAKSGNYNEILRIIENYPSEKN